MSPRLKADGAEERPHSKRVAARKLAARLEHNASSQFVFVQSLPETVQFLRPPGNWTVPGAFFSKGPFRAPVRPTCLVRPTRPVRYNGGMSQPPSPPPGAERLLRWIMVGIVVWGVFHAIGAWTLNHDARRPLVVLACVAAFLGFWLVMLSTLRRK
jgi:hypothetical protein